MGSFHALAKNAKMQMVDSKIYKLVEGGGDG